MPMARVMVMTRPKGAKPVKFLSMFSRNQIKPALEMGFWMATTSSVEGLTAETPARLRRALITATMTNR